MKRIIATILAIALLLPNAFALYDADAIADSENISDYSEESGIEAIALDATNTPEVITDEQIEENGHIARIFSAEQELNSIVFLNEDDSATLYCFENDVKYIDNFGKVRDKSNQLYSAYDDPQFAADYSYVNSDNDINTYFPKVLSVNTGVVLQAGINSIAIAPATDMAATARKVDAEDGCGDSVYYTAPFGPNTELRYTPTFEGFKEDIILQDGLLSEFSFIVSAGNLTPILEDNQLLFANNYGEPVIIMAPIYVYDSCTNDPNDGYDDDYCHNTWDNTIELQSLEDGEYQVIIKVDEDFLLDERTQYPVYVDPSFGVTTSGSGTYKTIQDAPLYNGGDMRSTPCGTNPRASVGLLGSSNGKSYGVGRLLMKFPGLLDNTTYKSLKASSITKVSLTMREMSGQYRSSTIYAFPYSGSNWYESSATYNSASWDNYGSPSASLSIGSSSQTNVSFDITNIVKMWKSNPYQAEKGLLFKNQNENSSLYRKDFSTTEGSFKPVLAVTYVFYGCKPYVQENSSLINCHGYACFIKDWPALMSSTDADYCREASTTTAQALQRTKTKMQSWLNTNFSGRWKEVYDPNITLSGNQWLIVMRVGKRNDAPDAYKFDYHFWYRTDTGPWANKHGGYSSVKLPASDLPTTNSSSGWTLSSYDKYYNSSIVYYVLSER